MVDTSKLKTISKILSIVVLITIIASLLYHQLLMIAGVLSLFYVGFDTYTSLKTSKLDFAIDILVIIAIALLTIYKPTLSPVSILASAVQVPIAQGPIATLKLTVSMGLVLYVVFSALEIMHMHKSSEIEM